jgi:hypothetical protein
MENDGHEALDPARPLACAHCGRGDNAPMIFQYESADQHGKPKVEPMHPWCVALCAIETHEGGP